MSFEHVFGATTTTVPVSTIKSLASKSGSSPVDFINTIASSFCVSVHRRKSDDVFVLEGTWDSLIDLGNRLVQMRVKKGHDIDTASEFIYINSSARYISAGDESSNCQRQETCPEVVSECSDSSSPQAGSATQDTGSQEAPCDTHRKSSRYANKDFPNYAEDDDDTIDSEDSQVEEPGEKEEDADGSFESEATQAELLDVDLSVIEDMIEETDKLINTQDAAFPMPVVYSDTASDLAAKHPTVNQPSKSYQCKKCIFISSDKLCVEEHVKRKHIDKNMKVSINRCSVCSRCFRKKCDLVRHMTVHDTGNHICLRCGKKFKTNSGLRAHIPTHKDGYVLPEFKCATCGKVYSTKYVLANHVKTTHKGEAKKFSCNICNREFTQKGSMMTHKKVVHQGEKLYHCSKCTAEFNHSRLLKNHLQKVHKIVQTSTKADETIKCDQCNFTTTTREYLLSHMRRSHTEKSLTCMVCNAKFSYATGLRKHMKCHRSICQCSVCNKVYKDPRSLERHIKTHEKDYVPDTVQCNICKLNVANKYVLAIHKKRKHGEGEEIFYKCEDCDRTFKHKTSLQEHQMMHRGQRPWQCKICGNTFTYRTSLGSHMRRHSEEANHMCDVCGKAFKSRDTLRIHSVIHTDPDRFKCYCGKGFTQKQALVRHQRTHSGEKPFLCHLCPEAFNDSSILRRHLQGLHKTPYIPKFKRFKPTEPQKTLTDNVSSQPEIPYHEMPNSLSNAAVTDNLTAAHNDMVHDQFTENGGPRKPSQPSHALSLLAGLCAAADHASNYSNTPQSQEMYNPPAYSVLPPESPSMPALIPVTQPCSPPPDNPHNLSTLVSTAFQTMQPASFMTPATYCGQDISVNKTSW